MVIVTNSDLGLTWRAAGVLGDENNEGHVWGDCGGVNGYILCIVPGGGCVAGVQSVRWYCVGGVSGDTVGPDGGDYRCNCYDTHNKQHNNNHIRPTNTFIQCR